MTAPALVKRYGKGTDSDATDAMVVANTLKGQRGRGGGGIGQEETLIADTLTSGSHPGSNMPGRRREDDTNIVAFHPTGGGEKGLSATENETPGVGFGNGGAVGITDGAMVRRLTPVECERLQGFPDHWTRVPDNAPDSRRYAALGDAVTVPVAHWLGLRIRSAA